MAQAGRDPGKTGAPRKCRTSTTRGDRARRHAGRGVVVDRGQRLHRLHGRVRDRQVPDERRPVQPRRDRLVPAPRDVRCLDPVARHLDGHRHRDGAGTADRPRERHLPLGIRHAQDPPASSSRSSRSWPASRASSSGSSPWRSSTQASSRPSFQRRKRSRSWRQGSRSASCPSRSSRPSPRTPCGPSRDPFARPRTASARGG